MTNALTWESSADFTARANRLLEKALTLSRKHDGGELAALNRCVSEAKRQRMTWVDGLEYTVARLSNLN